jgi:hypothetical protein
MFDKLIIFSPSYGCTGAFLLGSPFLLVLKQEHEESDLHRCMTPAIRPSAGILTGFLA